MDIEGDIEVWTEGDTACARLKADTPEGPLVVQASAPLAPIRRRVAMAFERHGIEVSGEDPGYQATVRRLARRKALRRLSVMAPKAFKRGGLASYVARRELAKRRKRRLQLEQAGRPVGAKAIGTLSPAKKKRRRRFVALKKPRILGRLTSTMAPALASMEDQPALAAVPSEERQANGTPPERAEASAPAEEEREEAPSEDADESEDEEDSDEDAPEGDKNDGKNEGKDDGDEEKEPENMGADPVIHLKPGHVRAAAMLLRAAQHHPEARRRVRHIVELAGEGDSIAQKAVKALRAAKNLVIPARFRKPAPPPPPTPPPRPKPRVMRRPAPVPPPIRQTATTSPAWRRWLDIFASWRHGVG